MRYLVFSLLLMFTAGCTATKTTHISAGTEVSDVDLRRHADRSFLVTLSDSLDDLDGVSFVTVTAWPEADLVEEVDPTFIEEPRRMWKAGTVDTQHVVERAYEHAAELGADALALLQIRPVTTRRHGVELEGIEVSGLAIRRD